MLALSPADFEKLIADETEKWGKVVKFVGIKGGLNRADGARYSVTSVQRMAGIAPAFLRLCLWNFSRLQGPVPALVLDSQSRRVLDFLRNVISSITQGPLCTISGSYAMFRMQRLLLSILIAAGNVSFGNAATVRPMHEWSYEQGADYYLLRYLHEAWDNESTGFTIECRAGDKTTLTIGYTVMDDNYFKAYKRKRLKPKIEIRSVKGQLTVDGELEEDGLFPAFAFSIPQSSSIDVLKILSGSNAVMVFPNRSFKIGQIKRSSEISKFLSACANKRASLPR